MPLYNRKSIKSGSSVAVLIPAELQRKTGFTYGVDVIVFFDERSPGVFKIFFGDKISEMSTKLDEAQNKVFEDAQVEKKIEDNDKAVGGSINGSSE